MSKTMAMTRTVSPLNSEVMKPPALQVTVKTFLIKSKTTTSSQVLSVRGLRTRYVTAIGPFLLLFSNCLCLKGAKWGTDNNVDDDDIDRPADNSRINKALDKVPLNASSDDRDFDVDDNLVPSNVIKFFFVSAFVT